MRAHALISKRILGVFMRPINVSLCSTTWELAKEKANFSGWVRRKLMEEKGIDEDHEEKPIMFEAICEPCDIVYANKLDFMVEHQYCKKCHQKCVYLGASQ